MNLPPLDDNVAKQYESYPYPEPARTLHDWHSDQRHLPDPELQHAVFWPTRGHSEGLDILSAGCGANQAAELAFQNPKSRVLGIDVSNASLASQQRLKDLHGLENLELVRHPIEKAAELGRTFDLIVSTGVLHHMADPDLGMRVLGGLLRPEGVMSLMLYAKHGWYPVRVMWELFDKLNLDMSPKSIDLIRETLAIIPEKHAIRGYLALGPKDLQTVAGLVDSFLHPRAKTYTVPEILEMVENSNLEFQAWQSNYLYYPEGLPAESATRRAIQSLPERQMWAAMELYYSYNATHYFHVCRKDRPRANYAIEFGNDRFVKYVPIPAPFLNVDRSPETGLPTRLRRAGIDCSLSAHHAFAFNLVDGTRSIEEVNHEMRAAGIEGSAQQFIEFAREFFRSLWRLELVYLKLPAWSA